MGIVTRRLSLRRLEVGDAPFIYRLLNQSSWKRYIGDRNIYDVQDAKRYIVEGPMKMYEKHNLGLLLVRIASSDDPIGLCGLLQRPYLDAPDLGFAMLTSAEGFGYAYEASFGLLNDPEIVVRYKKIWAFTSKENLRSQKLLNRLNFVVSTPPAKKEEEVNDLWYLLHL